MASRKPHRRKRSADQPDLPPAQPAVAPPVLPAAPIGQSIAQPVAQPVKPLRAVVRRGAVSDVAVGIRPMWARIGLVFLACAYYAALLHHPAEIKWLAPAEFFTEATALFPRASDSAVEYRLEGWSCTTSSWQLLDPRPYFPIQPDDKESRFQRLGHFYYNERPAMVALANYILDGHAAGIDDGVTGKIGGIQLIQVLRKVPPVGTPIERYHFDPMAPIPADQRKEKYHTSQSERTRRCNS